MHIYKKAICADGYSISIQGHEGAYCSPRRNTAALGYSEVELGFPTQSDELINEYAECGVTDAYTDEPLPPEELEVAYTKTVYPYVPVSIVQELIKKHGGIVEGECPPFRKQEPERFWIKLCPAEHIKVKTLEGLKDSYEENERNHRRWTLEKFIEYQTSNYVEIRPSQWEQLVNFIKNLTTHDM